MEFETLVKLVIAFALVAMIMLLYGIAKGVVSEQSDTACAASVRARATAVQIEKDADIGLKGCDTRYHEFKEGTRDKKILDAVTTDAQWCYMSFGVQENVHLIRDEDTFCHVCGVYVREDGEPLPDIAKHLADKGFIDVGDPELPYDESFSVPFMRTAEDDERLAEYDLSMEEPAALLYVQDRTEDKNLFEKVMSDRLVGAASGAVAGGVASFGAGFVAGAIGVTAVVGFIPATAITLTGVVAGVTYSYFVDEGASTTMSGIVIRPYNEEAIDALGCTTTTVVSGS